MNSSIKYGLFTLACLIIFVLGILTSGYNVTIPGMHLFGFIFIGVLLGLDVFLEYSKAKTAQVIADIDDNEGHWGINKRDVIKRRLYFDTINTETGEINKKEVGIFYIFFVGGVDYSGFSMRSHSDSPVMICHEKYVEIEGNNYHLHGVFHYLKHKQAGRCLHNIFMERGIRGRVKPASKINPGTDIYFAISGNIDFSTTQETYKGIYKMMEDNEYVQEISEKNKELYTLLNKDKETKKPSLYKKIGVEDED